MWLQFFFFCLIRNAWYGYDVYYCVRQSPRVPVRAWTEILLYERNHLKK